MISNYSKTSFMTFKDAIIAEVYCCFLFRSSYMKLSIMSWPRKHWRLQCGTEILAKPMTSSVSVAIVPDLM
jgi:hypothetical protein